MLIHPQSWFHVEFNWNESYKYAKITTFINETGAGRIFVNLTTAKYTSSPVRNTA